VAPSRVRAGLKQVQLGIQPGAAQQLVVPPVAGSVGSGFSHGALAECHSRLRDLEPAFCPFADRPDTGGDPVRWVRPESVVEALFETWSNDGRIRNPPFSGIRTDKNPREVVRETQAS
jgi:ATP-dependent DNA ligase